MEGRSSASAAWLQSWVFMASRTMPPPKAGVQSLVRVLARECAGRSVVRVNAVALGLSIRR